MPKLVLTPIPMSDDKNNTNLEEGDERKPRRRPSGNREAVRKYLEKKKAHTAYLEEEVKKLRAVNQQMVKKVQRQVVLEAEVMRLRGLLLKLRDKIDSEPGGSGSGFPFQKHFNPQALGSPLRQASKLDGCGNKMVFSLQHCQADCLNLNHMEGGKQKSGLDSLMSSSSHAEYPKE